MKTLATMTRQALLDTMKTFAIAYDIVRIVEPESTTVVCFDGKEYKKAQFEPCFSVWEKEERCENCISLRACVERHRMSKFEFRGEEAYAVISVPIHVLDEENDHVLAMELVNRVSEETIFQAEGQGEIAEEIQKLNHRAYEDSLTGVYNRRYYDENRHIYEMSRMLPKKVGYLLIDIDRFKYVNDTFGHACGDDLLMEVACVLKNHIRQTDRLMRIGGDEFLMMLRDCSPAFIEKKAEQLKAAVSDISLEWMKDYIPSVSAGMAYTEEFDGSPEHLEQMFKEADRQMYQNKQKPKMPKKAMLIVDDIKVNRTILKASFAREFEIFEAEDGEEALELLHKHNIGVVITDIYMPKMDGLTLTREIRKDEEISRCIIFVVTERGEQYELHALEAGADDFINKPFHSELIRHRLQAVLAKNAGNGRP